MAKRKMGSGIRVRGFFRVNIVEHDVDGAPRIIGDSGLVENVITMTGKQQYLALALAASAGSKFVSRMAIGTGGAPASNSTAIAGELAHMTGASSTRNRATVAVSTGSDTQTVTVQFAATWASLVPFLTAAATISNIALHWSENAAGTMFAGNTFNSSQVNLSQDVQASYIISFS